MYESLRGVDMCSQIYVYVMLFEGIYGILYVNILLLLNNCCCLNTLHHI